MKHTSQKISDAPRLSFADLSRAVAGRSARADDDDDEADDERKPRPGESREDFNKRMRTLDQQQDDDTDDGDDGDDEDDDRNDERKRALAAARRREQARCTAILTSAAARREPELAMSLALHSRMSRDEAIALLDRVAGDDASVMQRHARAASAAGWNRAFRVARGEAVEPKREPGAGWDAAFGRLHSNRRQS